MRNTSLTYWRLAIRRMVAVGVVSATLIACLLFISGHAHASKVFWGVFGYGWIVDNGNELGNASNRVSIDKPRFVNPDPGETLPAGYKKVRYHIVFNRTYDASAFSGITGFFVYLPKGLQEESIRITRTKSTTKPGFGGSDLVDEIVAANQRIKDFHNPSILHEAGLWPEESFLKHWTNGFIKTNPANNANPPFTPCEVGEWAGNKTFHGSFKGDELGRFARSLFVQQHGVNAKHEWTITAYVNANTFDPEVAPIMAGYDSGNTQSYERFYEVYGPYDTDNDGIPDVKEIKEGAPGTNPVGTNPFGGGFEYESLTGEYGGVLTTRPFMRKGELIYDPQAQHQQGGFHFKPSNKPQDRVYPEPLVGREFTIVPFSLSPSVKQVQTADVQEGQIYINPQTGEIRYRPAKAMPGVSRTLHLKVKVDYPGSTSCKREFSEPAKEVNFIVPQQDEKYHPQYVQTTVQAGERAVSAAPKDAANKPLPKGTTFAITQNAQQKHPWVTVNQNTGVLTLTPDINVTPKQYHIPIIVKYPEGSQTTVSAPVNVVKPPQLSLQYHPEYRATSVVAGKRATVEAPQDKGKKPLPQGTTFMITVENQKKYPWASIDHRTGVITLTPNVLTEPKQYDIPVTVTYPDKIRSKDIITAPVMVTKPADRDYYEPAYETTQVRPEETKQSQPPQDRRGHQFPKGTKFSISAENKRLPWVKGIDATTGVVTFNPPLAVLPDYYYTRVTVTYPDGTSEDINAPVKVLYRPSTKSDFTLKLSQKTMTVFEGMPIEPKIHIEASSKNSRLDIGMQMLCKAKDGTSKPVRDGINGWNIQKQSNVLRLATKEEEALFILTQQRDPKLFYRSDNIVARSTNEISGVALKPGVYQCAVYAASSIQGLNRLVASGNLSLNQDGELKYDDSFESQVLQGTRGRSWESETLTITVAPKLALPKTGGSGANELLAIMVASGTVVLLIVCVCDWFKPRSVRSRERSQDR